MFFMVKTFKVKTPAGFKSANAIAAKAKNWMTVVANIPPYPHSLSAPVMQIPSINSRVRGTTAVSSNNSRIRGTAAVSSSNSWISEITAV